MHRFAMCFLVLAASVTTAASAATLTVTDTGDAGSGLCNAAACTLRDAISSAAPGDTITFANSLTYPATITLGGQELLVYKDLTIIGPGAAKLAVDANQQSRIFEVANNANVSISGLRIEHGHVVGADGGTDSNGNGIAGGDARGGAVLVGAGSSLQIVDCVLADNRATGGKGGVGSPFFSGGDGGTAGSAFGGAIDKLARCL